MGLFGFGKKKSSLAGDVAALYAMQYMIVHGDMPSREKTIEWMLILERLSDKELLELGSDMDACKRILR